VDKDENILYDSEGKLCTEDRFINTHDLVKSSDSKGLLGNSVLFVLCFFITLVHILFFSFAAAMVSLQEKLSKKGVNKIVGSKMKDPYSINTILVGEKSVRGYLEGDGRECVGEKKGGGNEGRGGCNNKKGCRKGDSVFREGEEEKGREEGGKKVGGHYYKNGLM
jgi:hypothetical protein